MWMGKVCSGIEVWGGANEDCNTIVLVRMARVVCPENVERGKVERVGCLSEPQSHRVFGVARWTPDPRFLEADNV